MGQAGAVAVAMSRAMVRWFNFYQPKPGIDLRARYTAYDKTLIWGDHRQKEPKKAGRTRARSRPQKSYG
jgi:small subunit ribosomal protein S9